MKRPLLAALALCCLHLPASGDGFRVVTKIFEGDSQQSVADHLILFDNGLVYDLPLTEGRYITLYDEAQKQITLLDRLTQVQATHGTEDLIRIAAAARAQAKDDQQRERWGLLAKVTTEQGTGIDRIEFGNLAYTSTTQPVTEPAIAKQFGRFSLVAARLNLARRQGPPPFGRMTLTEHIARKNHVPDETTLEIKHGRSVQTYRSTLELTESLSEADRTRISEVRGMLQLYRDVDLETFPSE